MLIYLAGYDPLRDTIVDPGKVEASQLLAAIKRHDKKKGTKHLAKFSRLIDQYLYGLKPSTRSALVFTRMAFMLGEHSLFPKVHVDFFWEAVGEIVGPNEELIKLTLGTLFRWRISLLTGNQWLLWVDKTGEYNSQGKEITISSYWIDDNYHFQGIRPKVPATSVDLSKFRAAFTEKFRSHPNMFPTIL